MKQRPSTKVSHFRNNDFKHRMKRWEMPQKLGHDKFYVHEKILRSRNCRRKFIKNLLPEKRKKKRTFKPNNSDLNRD